MKRFILISIVSFAVAWIFYSSYELWINKDNATNPQRVFCKLDQSILLINKFDETKAVNYFEVVKQNPLSVLLESFDVLSFEGLKIFVSGNRPIIILEKESNWTGKEIENVKSLVKLNKVNFKHNATHLMIFQEYEKCDEDLPEGFLLDGDKKASANFWENKESQWKRTDIYNLNKGFFEYQSSEPKAIYGEAVRDIPLFSPQIPLSSNSYLFQERFYAEAKDSIFKNGPMSEWVDKGFVIIDYDGSPVIISDYRSQQVPSLILIEKATNEDSVQVFEDMHSFTGFQLTDHFPTRKNGRFYCFEIEDKVLFAESKNIARKILVDYQLGKTLALSQERQEQFFGGLPSYVNMRAISTDKKASLTWKDKLLFEVNTQPPSEQLVIADKTTWSVSANHETFKLVPIIDHLRNGTSVLSYSKTGKYELFGPNGKSLWKGDLQSSIEGEVKVIDVFDNNKFQFLLHTKKQIFLIDLNGDFVGGFPYRSDDAFTSEISDFVWSGTKRFLIGNQKGEIAMINSAGQELNIIQVGKDPIVETPYALNIKGNLRAWAINTQNQQYLGYLETPAKAKLLRKLEMKRLIKHDSKIISFYESEGKVFSVEYDTKTDKVKEPKFIDNGEIFKVNNDHLIIADKNQFKVFDYNYNIIYSKRFPFNEVGEFNFHKDGNICVVLDYLQNKIHAYDKVGDEIKDFPKEGRNTVVSHYNKNNQTLYVYTIISQSIICYKTKI